MLHFGTGVDEIVMGQTMDKLGKKEMKKRKRSCTAAQLKARTRI